MALLSRTFRPGPRAIATWVVAVYLAAATVRGAGFVGALPYALAGVTGLFALMAQRMSGPRGDAVLGLMLLSGSVTAQGGNRAFLAIAALLASRALMLSLHALEGPGGLARGRESNIRGPLAVMTGGWGVSALLLGIAAFYPAAGQGWAIFFGPLALSLGCLGTVIGRRLLTGYLELGLLLRLAACSIILGLAIVLAVFASLVTAKVVDVALVLAFVTAAPAVVLFAELRDHAAVARVARRIGTLGVIATPILVVSAGLSGEIWHRDATGAAAVTGIVLLLTGMLIGRADRLLLPGGGAHWDAAKNAERASRKHDPDQVLPSVLQALKDPFGVAGDSPAIYTQDPPRRRWVNTAGYLEESVATWPAEAVRLAREEPWATLRAEVLSALAVRRPDTRRALHWMEHAGVSTITIITRDGEPDAILSLPAGGRQHPLLLEEAIELKGLTDSLAFATAFTERLDRSMLRERALTETVDAREDDLERVRFAEQSTQDRHMAHTLRLARSAQGTVYAPLSRMAMETLERRLNAAASTVVQVPVGTDLVPYLARAHLAGARKHGPFVVVDATLPRDHDLERWRKRDESPLALAQGGVLVLTHATNLPHDVQRLIAKTLAHRELPFAPLETADFGLVLTSNLPEGMLRGEGTLDRDLALRLEDALGTMVSWPSLGDRAEDLRAMLQDRLSREGMRQKGHPVGLSDAAFATLVSHTFEGEEAELDLFVQKLVTRVRGELVLPEDLGALVSPVTAPKLRLVPRD
jgi:hypothetical protein